MRKNHTTLAFVISSSLVSGLTTLPAQATDASVFAMTELSSGYMQLAADTTTDTTKPATKAPEAKCAGDKPMTGDKAKEGKCGEGKCGEGMKGSDGKAKEGKCGGTKNPADDGSKKPADSTTPPADAKK